MGFPWRINVSFCLLDNIALRNRKQVASNAFAIKEPSDKLRRNECPRLSYRRHSFTDCISELLENDLFLKFYISHLILNEKAQ
ncbi:hypothetical protein OUZ56_013245 [Daphnia magna]|uniref:Uncharacterized protein n=1 Tax=Daphnia magna TaxID=35525 RepID=A0ABQ9Z5B2_9CRUS|nr:hypothetical protein OUZ56_013245 [Daphnia magna]